MTKDSITDIIIDRLDSKTLKKLSDRELSSIINTTHILHNRGIEEGIQIAENRLTEILDKV